MNVYQIVTDKIIEQMESGIIPWHKPWKNITDYAYNRVTKKRYSLLNQMLLKHSGEYATFKQWSNLGCKIKKGAKSEIVVFWKMLSVDDTDKNGNKKTKTIPMLRYYNVFHISQVDGIEPLEANEFVEHNPIEEAETIVSNYINREGIDYSETESNKAYYSPKNDSIVVPCKKQFENINWFYSTLFHECTHSTGASNRLNRFNENSKIAAFGSEDYSLEELVAELGAAMLMGVVGIETTETLNNSTAYIQSWIRALKNDNRMIVKAASKAEKAAKYIQFGNDMQPATN